MPQKRRRSCVPVMTTTTSLGIAQVGWRSDKDGVTAWYYRFRSSHGWRPWQGPFGTYESAYWYAHTIDRR